MFRRELLDRGIHLLVQERERVFGELKKRSAVQAWASTANFILVRTALPAREVFERLYNLGVLVRDVSAYPLLDRCLRVSIGTPEENDKLLAALDRALEKN